MISARSRKRGRDVLCTLLAATIAFPMPGEAGEVIKRARAFWHNHQGVPTAESLAVEVKCLEKHIDCYGSIVAKQPDVWGQARMMKHREDFEKQIAKELPNFKASLQGSLSRTDQAYLASAFSLSAAISGPAAVQLPQTAATSRQIVGRQRALLRAQGVTNPTPDQLAAAGTPQVINPPTSNPASDLVQDFSQVINRRDVSTVQTGVDKFVTDTISLEPTEFLNQMANYLFHLNELRRINEGDDTADSPGYGLQLFRIPVSVLPGSLTRKGYGAEITVTATPYLGRDLLPSTFRNLVINDVISQTSTALTEFFNSRTSLATFQDLRNKLISVMNDATRRASEFEIQNAPKTGAMVPRVSTGRLMAQGILPTGKRDGAVRRTAQGIQAAPLPNPAPSPPPPNAVSFEDEYNRALINAFRNTPLGERAGLNAQSGARATQLPATLSPPFDANVARNFLKRTMGEEIKKSVAQVSSRSVPALRSRNARYAFPDTQMGEVYGEDLILPVALQTYDVALRGRIEDDPGIDQVIQYQRVAGYVQDQVVAAYDLLSRPELASIWTNFATPALATAVRTRDAVTIGSTRSSFLASLPNGGADANPPYGTLFPTTTTAAFAWAILVESVLLNERLIQDIHEAAAAKGLAVPPVDGIPFFLPCPPDEARNAFNDYVRIRFPIHVFALDPVNQEQNIADQLARTRELQLALSMAFVTGNISAGSMTRFARRLELQGETIALNRTQVAFSHGDDIFGWRFQPRFQTPPTQNNLAAFGQTLIGGPTRDGDRRQLELEPGMRECVALVIMPSFVPYVTFETRSNWYRLNSPKHAEIDPLTFLALSRSVQKARTIAEQICDAGQYRDGDIARLVNRVNQLSAELPMQSMISQVPFENTHGGFELFNVGVTDLNPELRSWYGAPGVSSKNPTSLFLVGDSFSVHETSVVIGNKLISNDDLSLLSRQVMRVNVPPATQTVLRGGQPFVEATIATPYGVSQPVYIPVVDAEPARAEAPVSAFSITPNTQDLKIAYEFTKDPANPTVTVGNGRPSPGGQAIDIVWSSPTGVAPLQIQIDFNFDYKGAPVRISSPQPIRPTGQGGLYRIQGDALAQITQEYVQLLDQLDDFSIDKKLPELETVGISVLPVSGGTVLDAQRVAMTNSLKITPTPIPQLPFRAGATRQMGTGTPQAAPLEDEGVSPPPIQRGETPPPPPPPSAPGDGLAPSRRSGLVAPLPRVQRSSPAPQPTGPR